MKKSLLIIIFLIVLMPPNIYSFDMKQFIYETQKVDKSNDRLKIMWWIPNHFWKVTFDDNNMVSEEVKNNIYQYFSNYIILVIVDVKMLGSGKLISEQKNKVIKKTYIITHDNDRIHPFKQRQLPQDMQDFLSQLKPNLSTMLGPLGQSMFFIVFESEKDGKKIVDPSNDELSRISYKGNEYTWRLPLGSMLPPKMDKKTNEVFPGNYKYNPYTGSQLIKKE